MPGAKIYQAVSVFSAIAVVISGVYACFVAPSDEVAERLSEMWRMFPRAYGALDLLIGLAVLVWTISPQYLLSGRSEVKWTGGAFGAKAPPNTGFVWNPASLLMATLCFGSLTIAEFAALNLVISLPSPSAWPKAILAVAHLWTVVLLFRGTRQVLNAAPS